MHWYLCVCGEGACRSKPRSKGSLKELVLSSHHACLGIKQVVRLGSLSHHPLFS